ncbi:hypothetical protein [Streptomyces anulatus]
MGAVFEDAAVVEDDDAVGGWVLPRRWVMRMTVRSAASSRMRS